MAVKHISKEVGLIIDVKTRLTEIRLLELSLSNKIHLYKLSGHTKDNGILTRKALFCSCKIV